MRTELSSVAELPEMHLMGHTSANLNGDLIFVWGGTNDSVSYSSVPNTDLWIYETLTGYWRHRKCSGECPPYLSSCSSVLIGQKMYIFGGHSTAQDNWLNCLYCLDLDTFIWRDLGAQAKAEPTKPIRSDKNVAWSYDNKLYVFGGYGWSQVEHYLELIDCQADLQLVPDFRWPKFGWNNQLVEYSPTDRTWRWPSYRGKCPTARAAHSGALMGDKYFVFGGRDSHERLNDLYIFNMKTFEWQQVATFAASSSIAGHHLAASRRQPIGHLGDDHAENELNDDDDDDDERPLNNREAAGGNDNTGNDNDDEDSEQLDMVADDENHRQLVEEMHDVEVDEDDCWNPQPAGQSSCSLLASTHETTSEPNRTNMNVEENEEDFQYPHPSHLLERWSLSARNPHADDGPTQRDERDELRNNADNDDPDCLNQASNTHQHQEHNREQDVVVIPADGNNDSQPANRLAVVDNNQILINNQQQEQQPTLQGHNHNHQHQQQQQQNNQSNDGDQQQADHRQDQLNDLAQAQIENCVNSTTAQTLPTGRSFCSLTPISHETMLLFGGVDSSDRNLDDCWLFNINTNQWTQITDYKHKRSRLWHTGAKTKQNEVVIMGGSSSEKIDEYCTDVMVMSFEPKTLKRLALDAVSRSVRMKTIQRSRGLPSTLVKLIKLRKQAMALTMRRSTSHRVVSASNNN